MFDSAPATVLLGLPFAGGGESALLLDPGVMIGASVAAGLGVTLAGFLSRHFWRQRSRSARPDRGGDQWETSPAHAFARHGPVSHAVTGFLAGGAWARPSKALVASLDELGHHYLTQGDRWRAVRRGLEPDPSLLDRLSDAPSRRSSLRWTGNDLETRTGRRASEPAAAPAPRSTPAPALRYVAAPDPSTPAESSAATVSSCERVIVGDVPGLSGAWLTQYAQQRADDAAGSGPVVLLKIHAEGVDVEVVSPRSAGVTPEDRSAGWRNGTADRDAAVMLGRLLKRRHRPVVAVLMHFDGDLAPPAGCDPAAAVTLLTSADKPLSDRALRNALAPPALTHATEPAAVGLVLVGAPEPACRQACRRIAADHPDIDVTLVATCHQFRPVRSNALGTFKTTPDFWKRLTAWTGSAVRSSATAEGPLQTV